MPKQEGQKSKLLTLLRILEQKTDEEHLLNVPQLVQLLEQQGILAERKSIFSDSDTLRSLGFDVQLQRGRGGGYWLASRTFELSELKLLVDAAYQKGHRKIAYVHGEKSSVTENRIIGFYRAMQEHGLNVNPDFVVEALYDNPATSMQAVLNLMDRPDPPTCILLPDDHSTLGALQAAKQLNLRVPEDLSLAGYDGIRLTQMLQPRLTTIEQDAKRIGAQAAEFLIDRIENPRTAGSETATIPVKLLEGESMGICPVKTDAANS